MDADSIKIVVAIFYLTILVVIACIWFRVSHAPNGDLYRKVRREGGYQPIDPLAGDELTNAAGYGARNPNSST